MDYEMINGLQFMEFHVLRGMFYEILVHDVRNSQIRKGINATCG